MNLERINRGSGAALGFIIAAGLFVAIAVGVKMTLVTPPIDEQRVSGFGKALAEIRASEETSLTTAAVIDAQRGLVRLPIVTAMQLAAEKWKNPAAARADLNARADKAAAELPKAPEKPSQFE
ncbi:MAG TPA: hypothetical protein VF988_00490 [Verrucomicrobiae bacterium]